MVEFDDYIEELNREIGLRVCELYGLKEEEHPHGGGHGETPCCARDDIFG